MRAHRAAPPAVAAESHNDLRSVNGGPSFGSGHLRVVAAHGNGTLVLFCWERELNRVCGRLGPMSVHGGPSGNQEGPPMAATSNVRRIAAAVTLALVVIVGSAACSENKSSAKSRSISVTDPWAMNATMSQGNGAAFMTVENTSSVEDELVGVTVPSSVAASAQMHDVKMEGDMMKMEQVQSVSIPANGIREFKHGSFHIMLMELKAPLEVGSTIQLTLTFKNAGEQTVTVPVEKS